MSHPQTLNVLQKLRGVKMPGYVSLFEAERGERWRRRRNSSPGADSLEGIIEDLSEHESSRSGKGTSIYDVRSGWGEGGPQKADKRNKISTLSVTKPRTSDWRPTYKVKGCDNMSFSDVAAFMRTIRKYN